MQRLDFKSLIHNMKPKGVSEMPYQEKPQFQEVEQSHAGEKVVLEGVKVTFVFDLAQGNGWTRQDFKVERDGCETKVKYWRPEKVLSAGQVVTVVGGVEEYQGKKSVSVDAKKGGGIASEGEPLAVVAPTPQPTQAPAAQPKATGRKSFLVIFYEEVLKKFETLYSDEQAKAAAVHSIMIAYNRNEISEEELSRWLAADDDVPF